MAPRDSYDAIAALYDADMGSRMRFDDAAFYARLAGSVGREVLEVGCGNGRVTLPLRRAGLDVVGIDRSVGMLARLRERAVGLGLDLPVAAMDMRRIAVGKAFDAIVCPYSVITYAAEEGEALGVVGQLTPILRPGGLLALDAFVPRPVALGEHVRDYRVAFGNGFLERHKRITAHRGGTHVIERFYSVQDAEGRERERVDTVERIRPFTAAGLAAIAGACGLEVERCVFDYGATDREDSAQYATVIARKKAGAISRGPAAPRA